jgi:hypothetical protein
LIAPFYGVGKFFYQKRNIDVQKNIFPFLEKVLAKENILCYLGNVVIQADIK